MGKHNNPTIVQDLQRILNPKVGQIPTSLVGDVLVPVVIIGRYANIVSASSRAVTGTGIFFTTPANKDFYLTSLYMSSASDATADNVRTVLRVSVKGVLHELLVLRKITATETVQSQFMPFPMPLKLDRGTNINIITAFTAGAETAEFSLTGYTVETVANSD